MRFKINETILKSDKIFFNFLGKMSQIYREKFQDSKMQRTPLKIDTRYKNVIPITTDFGLAIK